MSIKNPLDIQDYLEATSDASKRTRTVTIILVVASVLVVAGLLNSLQSHWMHLRLKKLNDIKNAYTVSKLGPAPKQNQFPDSTAYEEAHELYRQRYINFCAIVAQAEVENYGIRVPFFGFGFDVNDLGLLGGFGFLVILVCYRFCLSREVDNLRLSFDEAHRLDKLREFYNLLAMRQVFTVPLNQHIKRTCFLAVTPKFICWLPFYAHMVVMIHDFDTALTGKMLDLCRTQITLAGEIVIAVFVFLLCLMAKKRMVRLDQLWDECWQQIEEGAKQKTEAKTKIAAQRDDNAPSSEKMDAA